MDKLEVAERQLLTSSRLFIANDDPVSVHTLACSGANLAADLIRPSGREGMREAVQQHFSADEFDDFRKGLNQTWNAFKHDLDRKGTRRQDDVLLADFNDEMNELVLVRGWFDFEVASQRSPAEAKGFTAWFLARHPTSRPQDAQAMLDRLFGDLASMTWVEQKQRLGLAIEVIRELYGQ